MLLTRSYICSEREGSVVNLDLEDAISRSFHFMIYISLCTPERFNGVFNATGHHIMALKRPLVTGDCVKGGGGSFEARQN